MPGRRPGGSARRTSARAQPPRVTRVPPHGEQGRGQHEPAAGRTDQRAEQVGKVPSRPPPRSPAASPGSGARGRARRPPRVRPARGAGEHRAREHQADERERLRQRRQAAADPPPVTVTHALQFASTAGHAVSSAPEAEGVPTSTRRRRSAVCRRRRPASYGSGHERHRDQPPRQAVPAQVGAAGLHADRSWRPHRRSGRPERSRQDHHADHVGRPDQADGEAPCLCSAGEPAGSPGALDRIAFVGQPGGPGRRPLQVGAMLPVGRHRQQAGGTSGTRKPASSALRSPSASGLARCPAGRRRRLRADDPRWPAARALLVLDEPFSALDPVRPATTSVASERPGHARRRHLRGAFLARARRTRAGRHLPRGTRPRRGAGQPSPVPAS